LVTISIGGNDARFADIITYCEGNIAGNCKDGGLLGDPDILSVWEPQRIGGPVESAIELVLREIHKAAPNAQIALMGYPEVITWSTAPVGCTINIGSDEVLWMGTMTAEIDKAMRRAATVVAGSENASVLFADPLASFSRKGACGSPEGINQEILTKTAGDDQNSVASQESFHPNAAGQQLYAQVLIGTPGLKGGNFIGPTIP
jgi:hypothetical protein